MVRFSPEIIPAKYSRNEDSSIGNIVIKKYEDWELDIDSARASNICDVIDDDMIKVDTFMGDLYYGDGHCHVDETMYDTVRLVVLREVLASKMSELVDEGVIENVTMTGEIKIGGNDE